MKAFKLILISNRISLLFRIIVCFVIFSFFSIRTVEAAGLIKPMPVKTLKEMVEGESRTSLDVRDFAGYDAEYAAYIKELIESHPDAGLSLEELREKYTLDWFGEEYGKYVMGINGEGWEWKNKIEDEYSVYLNLNIYRKISVLVNKSPNYIVSYFRNNLFKEIGRREKSILQTLGGYALRRDVLVSTGWLGEKAKNIPIETPEYLEIVRIKLNSFPLILRDLPYEIRDDEGMVRIACYANANMIEYATERYRDDEDFIQEILRHDFSKEDESRYERSTYSMMKKVSKRIQKKYEGYSMQQITQLVISGEFSE